MHTFNKEMIEYLFDVSSQYNRTITIEDQEMLQIQRKKKLKR